MPRNIDTTLLTALASGQCWPVAMMQLTFRSATRYVWSGVGTLSWNGNSFLGVGSLGALGDVHESAELKADGTSVSLSGLDPSWLGEALTDIQIGAPAYRWLGAVQPGSPNLVGNPYMLFSGQVDKPSIYTGADKVMIQLALESRLVNHARANVARYTAADQHARGYPDDTGLNWVEIMNDLALLWG